MIIKDISLLESSKEFTVTPREEVVINLSLDKSPHKPNTLLNGIVINNHCKPICGATVKIFTLDYTPVEHRTTDCKGKFCFNRVLMPGQYYIVATAEGYYVTTGYKINIYPKCKLTLRIKLCKNNNLICKEDYLKE